MLISNREELAESGERGQNPDTLSHLVHSNIPATFLFPENRGNTLASLLLVILYSLFIPSCLHAGLLDNRQLCCVLCTEYSQSTPYRKEDRLDQSDGRFL